MALTIGQYNHNMLSNCCCSVKDLFYCFNFKSRKKTIVEYRKILNTQFFDSTAFYVFIFNRFLQMVFTDVICEGYSVDLGVRNNFLTLSMQQMPKEYVISYKKHLHDIDLFNCNFTVYEPVFTTKHVGILKAHLINLGGDMYRKYVKAMNGGVNYTTLKERHWTDYIPMLLEQYQGLDEYDIKQIIYRGLFKMCYVVTFCGFYVPFIRFTSGLSLNITNKLRLFETFLDRYKKRVKYLYDNCFNSKMKSEAYVVISEYKVKKLEKGESVTIDSNYLYTDLYHACLYLRSNRYYCAKISHILRKKKYVKDFTITKDDILELVKVKCPTMYDLINNPNYKKLIKWKHRQEFR